MRNKCEERKRIYRSAPHLAHVPEATRSYPAANSPQNLRVRDMLPALSELDMFTGWKAGKLLNRSTSSWGTKGFFRDPQYVQLASSG